MIVMCVCVHVHACVCVCVFVCTCMLVFVCVGWSHTIICDQQDQLRHYEKFSRPKAESYLNILLQKVLV